MPVVPGRLEVKHTIPIAAVVDGTAAIFDSTTSHADITSGSLRGTRSHFTIPSGTTIGGGAFVMGGQHKLTCAGTMNHADSRVMGGFCQLDISAGTYTTGQLSGLWVDCGASASASAVSTKGGGQFNILRLQNTTAASTNSIIYCFGDSDYLLDLGAPSGNADWFDAGTGATADVTGHLKINLNGTPGFLRVYETAS